MHLPRAFKASLSAFAMSLLLWGCHVAPPVNECPPKADPPPILMVPPPNLSKECLRMILEGGDWKSMCQKDWTGTAQPAPR